MLLTIYSARCVASGTAAELADLERALTFPLKKRRGPKALALYDRKSQSFALGLVHEAQAALRLFGHGVAVVDRRPPPTPRRGLPLSWLEPHQRQAVDLLIGERRACADMPTASGKGEVIAALAAELPIPWLILCDDKAVFSMLSDPEKGRIVLRSGEPPGRIGAGLWEEARVIVASTQSLDPHWDGQRWSPQAQALFDRTRGRIYDEVHMSGSDRSQRILRAMRHLEFSIGLSATLEGRSDNRDPAVRAMFGRTIYHLSTLEMEARGRTTEQRILMLRRDQPNTPRYDQGGYQKAISLSKPRNQLVALVMQKYRAGGLVYVRELPHLRYLLQIARALGFKAEAICGDTGEDERKAIVERFELGETEIVIATDAFRQGADIIHVRWGFNAAGMRSPIATIQRRGRGARVCRLPIAECPNCQRLGRKGEDAIPWFDVWDMDSAAEKLRQMGQRAPGLWLQDHATARYEAYAGKGLTVRVVTAASL